MATNNGDTVEKVLADFAQVCHRLIDLKYGADTNSRELSLAVTNAEQAHMWLERALRVRESVGNE